MTTFKLKCHLRNKDNRAVILVNFFLFVCETNKYIFLYQNPILLKKEVQNFVYKMFLNFVHFGKEKLQTQKSFNSFILIKTTMKDACIMVSVFSF